MSYESLAKAALERIAYQRHINRSFQNQIDKFVERDWVWNSAYVYKDFVNEHVRLTYTATPIDGKHSDKFGLKVSISHRYETETLTTQVKLGSTLNYDQVIEAVRVFNDTLDKELDENDIDSYYRLD